MSAKQLRTDLLDDAMRDLIDICQQYNEKLSSKKQVKQRQPAEIIENEPISNGNISEDAPSGLLKGETLVTRSCDNKEHKKTSSAYRMDDSRNSIEKLQQRQSELQKQLDEVLTITKTLDLKQRRKLGKILGDNGPRNATTSDVIQLDDDDDELIEFQQIENELKLTELNRQMSHVQEELRLTLYKQLLTNSTNATRSHQTNDNNHRDPPVRRNSAQTDESTPPSSSCSDEQTATSSTASTTPRQQPQSGVSATSSNNSFDLASQFADRLNIGQNSPPQQSTTSNTGEFYTAERDATTDTNSDTSSIKSNSRFKNNQGLSPTVVNQTDIDMVLEQINNYEINLASASGISKEQIATQSHCNQEYQAHHSGNANIPNSLQLQSTTYASSYRSASGNANKDLERIDEGEEDDQDDYCNPELLRTVYQEKLSPQARSNALEAGQVVAQKFNVHGLSERGPAPSHSLKPFFQVTNLSEPSIQQRKTLSNEEAENLSFEAHEAKLLKSPEPNYDKFNPNNVNSAKRSNRPLTMYLPKPDEDINLLEHVQALGHDIELISADLKLEPLSACGYLYKSCSNNPKKWLKRYFYFDRKLKFLSYYESEEQANKKNCPPRNRIPFDEIGDVYVDHSLSTVSEKQKTAKRSSYVFVLATTKRKYTLSSPRAETMRAWIDILFTAAKANDYFQHLAGDEDVEQLDDSCEAQYTSLVE